MEVEIKVWYKYIPYDFLLLQTTWRVGSALNFNVRGPEFKPHAYFSKTFLVIYTNLTLMPPGVTLKNYNIHMGIT